MEQSGEYYLINDTDIDIETNSPKTSESTLSERVISCGQGIPGIPGIQDTQYPQCTQYVSEELSEDEDIQPTIWPALVASIGVFIIWMFGK